MTTYKVLDGYDAPLILLEDIVPQPPRSPGVRTTRRTYGLDGTVYEEGLYIELVFDVIDGSTDYGTLLTQFGLHNALTNEVTIYARDHLFQWARFNGIAVRPEIGRDVRWEFFPKDVMILVRDLVRLA